MPRSGHLTPSRPALLALAMLAWLLSPLGERSARASGCHVPDRPVLGATPTDQDGRHVPAWSSSEENDEAPPVLRRVPCPGETPHAPVMSASPIVAISLVVPATVAEPPSRSSHAFEVLSSPDPLGSRLDRPPE